MRGPQSRQQSLPQLVSSLTGQLSRLARAELALAKAELFANGRQAELTTLRDQADRSAAEAVLPVMLAAGALVYWRKRHTAVP